MPRLWCKNKIKNSQGNRSPLEPSYPTAAGPEYSNISEAEEKDLKTTCMKVIEVLKEEINEYLKKSMKTQTNSVRK